MDSWGGGVVISGQGTPNMQVQWGAGGSGVVQITETNQAGCSISVEHCITVIPLPIAFFNTQPYNDSQTFNSLEICSGQTVYFFGHVKQSSVQSPIASWYWDFNDPASGANNTSTDQNPNHIFSNAGGYWASLTITNECGCTNVAYMYIKVSPDAAVQIECPTPVCEGGFDTYSVNAQCAPPAGQYLWTIEPPGAGVITSPPPYGNTITVHWLDGSNGPGIVNDFFSCPDGGNELDVVIKNPFAVTGDKTLCPGTSPRYTAGHIGEAFTWTLLDASGNVLTGPTPPLTSFYIFPSQYSSVPGSYTLQATDVNGIYCNPTVNYSVTINPAPPPPTALTGELNICAGASYPYTCTPFNPTNILNWTVTGGTPAFGNGTTLSVSWGATTPYAISVTESDPNTGCTSVPIILPYCATPSSTNCIRKKVFTPPDYCALQEYIGTTLQPVMVNCGTITPLPGKACLNTAKKYYLIDFKSYNIDQYELSISPETAGTIVSSTVIPDPDLMHPGKFLLEINVQWNNIASPATQIKFKTYTCGGINAGFLYKVDVKGGEPISITGPATACDNVAATFNINPQPASGTFTIASYTWTWGDVSGSSQQATFDPLGISHTYSINSSGISTFPITVQLNVDGCLSSVSSFIKVNPGPGAYISATSSAYCGSPITLTALPAGMQNYVWSTGSTSQTTTANAAGNYTVTITGNNGCKDMAAVTIDNCPGSCTPLIGYSINFNTPVLNAAVCGEATISGTISGGPITSYEINYGDGTKEVITTTNPVFSHTHTFGYSGNQTACIMVYRQVGSITYCYSQCINVNIPLRGEIYSVITCPTAPTPTCYNYTFNVVPQSVTAVSSYNWLFDNAAAGTAPNSNLTPVCPTGNHTISVTMTNGTATCTETRILNQLFIPTPPGASFKLFNSPPDPLPPICQKQTVVNFNFSGSLQHVHHALWDFGDLSSYAPIYPTTVQNIDAKRVYDDYQNPNTKQVYLNVYDDYGCVYTANLPVQIKQNRLNGRPDPASQSFCPGVTGLVTYYLLPLQGGGNSITPTGYLWSTGATTATFPVTSTGQYYITVFDAASGCKHESPLFADVAVKNVPNLIIRGKSDYCDGEEIFFNGYSGNGTYDWQPLASGLALTAPSTTLHAAAIHLAPPAIGTYTVTLTILVNGCTASASKTFTVHAPPPKPVVTVQPLPGCENNDVLLTATNYATPLVLNWSQGGNTNPITVHNTGNYNATFTDPVTGCTNQSINVNVNPNPDISWLISGCLERCDNDNNHIIIPGSYSIPFARWTWYINGVQQGGLYTGAQSAVGDLDINNAMAGGGTLTPGVYIVELDLVNDQGCRIITDPVYITVRTCPCKINYVKENWYRCLGTDVNGQSFYHFLFTVHFNNFTPTGTFALTPNPVGGGSNITPWTYQVNGNDVIIEGILGYYRDEILPCFTLTYTDPDPAKSCTYSFCVKPPPCTSADCSWALEQDRIDCISLDANGNQTYSVSFNVNVPPGNWAAIYSLNGGTITGLPSIITGPGITQIQGTYTDLPPANNQLCLQVNFYEVTTEQSCFTYHCYELPYCGDDHGGNGRMAATAGTEVNVQPELTVLPNPAVNEIFARFTLPGTKAASLTLTNAQGTVISTKQVAAQTGYSQYNTSQLAPGIYYLTLQFDKLTVTGKERVVVTQKFTVIK